MGYRQNVPATAPQLDPTFNVEGIKTWFHVAYDVGDDPAYDVGDDPAYDVGDDPAYDVGDGPAYDVGDGPAFDLVDVLRTELAKG
jgi:hypothetical protein